MNFQFNKFLKILVFLLVPSAYLLVPSAVSAHCPLCVAGAVAGVTLTRWIGVDDSITGVWIGALLGATSLWFYSWLLTKNIKFVEKNKSLTKILIYLAIFTSTLWSFYKFNLVIRMSQIIGIDKLTFGILAGGVLFYLLDLVKIKHYFNYQKIVISLGSITILSLLIYILINYYI